MEHGCDQRCDQEGGYQQLESDTGWVIEQKTHQMPSQQSGCCHEWISHSPSTRQPAPTDLPRVFCRAPEHSACTTRDPEINRDLKVHSPCGAQARLRRGTITRLDLRDRHHFRRLVSICDRHHLDVSIDEIGSSRSARSARSTSFPVSR